MSGTLNRATQDFLEILLHILPMVSSHALYLDYNISY